MLLMILLAMLFAKFRHYKIKSIFLTWTFYPALLVELVFTFFQINVFLGNYYFIRYASYIKTADILVFIIPIIVFNLYKAGFFGAVFIVFGTVLNRFVISANNGKMPIYPTLSYITGYIKKDSIGIADNFHILGDASTKWKILTDYIDLGYSILSVGDLFIHSFAFIVTYEMIKALNLKQSLTER